MKGRRAALLFVVPAALLFLMIRASAKPLTFGGNRRCRSRKRQQARHPSSIAEKWVESTLRKMTVDEKIGQLLFTTYHGSFTATDAAAYRR